MRLTAAAVTSAINAEVAPLVQLVAMEFPDGTLGFNTANISLSWDGVTYAGAAGLGSISPIEDSAGEVKGLTLSLNGASAETIALALDDADAWQGVPVRVYTAVLDSNYKIAGVLLDWAGTGDVMSIVEDGEKCTISATAESEAVDLLRSNVMYYSAADQASVDSTDLGFNMVVDKSDEPIIWPAKEWFYK